MTDDEKPTARPRGRPRSADIETKVVATTLTLLSEVKPTDISVDLIAARSGISKATLYTRWPNRWHILIEVLYTELEKQTPFPDSGNTVADIKVLIRAFEQNQLGGKLGACNGLIFSQAMLDPDLRKAYVEKYVRPLRDRMAPVFDRGVSSGQLRAGLDLDTMIDMMVGPALFRHTQGHAPINPSISEQLLDLALDGIAGPAYNKASDNLERVPI